MSGMSTQLHIMADSVGSYNGVSANISGEGYADMDFKVHSLAEPEFTAWTKKAARSTTMLTSEAYAVLAHPTKNHPETTFMLMAPTLYDDIVMKYMHSKGSDTQGIDDTTESESGKQVQHQSHEGMEH
jgi:cytochrome o ubiquinol oxidase subunit 2